MALNYQKHNDKSWEAMYSSNIHSYLQYCEVEKRMIYEARSPQIHMRPILLKNIRYISKAYEISNVCVHLAVSLMDFFIDNHDLKFDTILLVSFACLTLATKVEEHSSVIPKLNCIRNIIGKEVTNSHFRLVEMKILMFFNYNVAVPTVAHFIEFYKQHYFCSREFYNPEVANILKNKFDNMVLFYQDITLESTKFISYNPSLVAASIILSTRHKLGLVPCWTAQLRRITGYLKKDLVHCCSLLGRNIMQYRRKYVPEDDGYHSSSPLCWSPTNIVTKKKRSRIDLPNIISSKRIAF